jgi:hypothetical protein
LCCLTIIIVTPTELLSDKLAAVLRQLELDPAVVTFDLSVKSLENSLACRQHENFDELSLTVEQIAVLATGTSCSCPTTALTMAPWCSDPAIAHSLMAALQLEALRALAHQQRVPEQGTKLPVDVVLQMTVDMHRHRKLVQVSLNELRAGMFGPQKPVLNRLVVSFEQEIAAYHARVFDSLPVRAALQRELRAGKAESDGWTMLLPPEIRYDQSEATRHRTIALALIASYSSVALDGPSLVRMPSWVYRHIRRHLPGAVASGFYPQLASDVRETALVLWSDGGPRGTTGFDDCLRTADRICR